MVRGVEEGRRASAAMIDGAGIDPLRKDRDHLREGREREARAVQPGPPSRNRIWAVADCFFDLSR